MTAVPTIDRGYIEKEFRSGGEAAIPRIAKDLGCHRHSVRRILREELKLLPPRQMTRPTPELHASADALLDGTIPFKEAADILGVSHDWLHRHYVGRGLRPDLVGTYREARRLEKMIMGESE